MHSERLYCLCDHCIRGVHSSHTSAHARQNVMHVLNLEEVEVKRSRCKYELKDLVLFFTISH